MAFDGRLLSGLGVLVAVVECESFARAAESLGLSDSGVSRAIARLEARVGIRLLDRTTRSLRLTDEGRRYYEAVAPLLAGIEAATAALSGASETVRGQMRIDIDPYFKRLVLAPRLPDFLTSHPDLQVEFLTRERIGDLVAAGIDLSLRFGPPPVGTSIARKLLDTRILTVAAPAYLERQGQPAHPRDLAALPCIQFRDPATGKAFDWEFQRGDEVVAVRTHGALMVGDVAALLSAALSGVGVAQVMALGVGDLLASGQLVELFPDWPDETFPLYAVYPSRRHPPAKVRAFIDFCLDAARASA